MKYQEFVEKELNELLWELASGKIEEVKEIRRMLEHISYVDDIEDILSSTTSAEMFDSDYDMLEQSSDGVEVTIKFKISYILNTYTEDEAILRVTGFAEGDCFILKRDLLNLEMVKFSEMGRQELLEYKPFIGFKSIRYLSSECDDLRVI